MLQLRIKVADHGSAKGSDLELQRREKPMGEKKGEERCRHKFLSATAMVLYLMLWPHAVLVNYVCSHMSSITSHHRLTWSLPCLDQARHILGHR